MKHLTPVVVALACLFAGDVVVAQPQVGGGARTTGAPVVSSNHAPTRVLALDSYSARHEPNTAIVTSGFNLVAKRFYVATVSGTFSYYAATNYAHPHHPWRAVCGSPEGGPEFPGSRGGLGPVGFDAEFVFARPCRAQMRLPRRWGNFQVDTGDGGWHHPGVIGTLPRVPNRSHLYRFALVGDGRPARFRLRDTLTRDNYGLLKIRLEPTTMAECEAHFRAFGFSTPVGCTR